MSEEKKTRVTAQLGPGIVVHILTPDVSSDGLWQVLVEGTKDPRLASDGISFGNDDVLETNLLPELYRVVDDVLVVTQGWHQHVKRAMDELLADYRAEIQRQRAYRPK
ncbi:MAG: hypothetical protein A2Y57_02400 [Candidatus Woykebacteria bacterium RBG_13_40_7b]|uniref:Uncharacterized protein n=1 Tax=Candidatus Woykebacteria bacterium RBG_13_40_7b TaxID=1802594 RepID=A0A1G1WB85_9BACT|nr:MAG: hypothetical protein A2Y57_02400 [Candidatus Woykebacteria bacterium RBG_13_40_7b]